MYVLNHWMSDIIGGRLQGRKDEIDFSRGKVWVEFCRKSLNAKSLYALEKALEAEAFVYDEKSGKFVCHRNKWRRYRNLGVIPQRQLIEQVDKVVPGSAAILDDPGWKIFRDLSDDERFDPVKMLRTLPPGVIKLLFVFGGENDGFWHLRAVTERTITQLERRGDLAGIAALSVLILESNRRDKGELALELGGALFCSLLRIAVNSNSPLAVAVPGLFEILRERVFPKASSATRRLCMERVSIQQVVELAEYLASIRRSGEANRNEAVPRFDFTDGAFTPIGFLAFAAPCETTKKTKKEPKESARCCDSSIVELWENAYAKLMSEVELVNNQGPNGA